MTKIQIKSPPKLIVASAIAGAYFAAAEFGLSLASAHTNVSPVWPPTGIAIASLLIFGRKFWPGILVGAFAANLLTEVTPLTAAGIAAGNTLEALTAWYFLNRFGKTDHQLDSIASVLRFILIAVLISPAVSATIGNLSLCAGGAAAWANFPNLWLTWWLGDGFGALIVAPFILAVALKPRTVLRVPAMFEAVLLLILLFVVGMLALGGWLPGRARDYPLEYLTLPILVWAAIRFDLRLLCSATLLLSGIAVWGTSQGYGPFIQESPNESLLLLQLFIGASTVTAFLLHASVQERRKAEIEKMELLQLEQEARAQAERASRLKDEFLASTSHELRTPLTAIVGWAKMLTSGGLGPTDTSRAFKVIEQNAMAQTRIVEDMLDVSRIITGKLLLTFAPVELEAVVVAAINVVRLSADARGIKINLNVNSDGLIVNGDAERLQQVTWNLLSNAVKFTPDGGEVDVVIRRESSRVKFIVADTGPGISAEFLPHAFERFTQADGSTTRKHGGLGLGLAIVRHLVELHGGTVEAENKKQGSGAIFTVAIPASFVSSNDGSEN